jgi:hypothetical protein
MCDLASCSESQFFLVLVEWEVVQIFEQSDATQWGQLRVAKLLSLLGYGNPPPQKKNKKLTCKVTAQGGGHSWNKRLWGGLLEPNLSFSKAPPWVIILKQEVNDKLNSLRPQGDYGCIDHPKP